MANETILKIENLSKKFSRSIKRSMFYGVLDVARSMVGIDYSTKNLRPSEFWALQNINLELHRGETLGIVGSNGSGKSTLLRLITGIFPPDEGRITVKGRVGSLIAVGAGFHPHMTGKENIYLNGTILGMTRAQIEDNLEEIISFADIGEFLDAPVSTYSSGMRVRLGFSIAVHSEPDILLVDEVLSVGDLSFRNKCLRKIQELRKKSRGIIFVSHDLEQVKILCTKVIILEFGKIKFAGDTYKALCDYQAMSLDKSFISYSKQQYVKKDSLSEKIRFIDLGILNSSGQKIDSLKELDCLTIFCDFELTEGVEDLHFSVGILSEDYKPCIWVMSNESKSLDCKKIGPGEYRLKVTVQQSHLAPNIYFPNIVIRNGQTNEVFERVWSKDPIRVLSTQEKYSRGIINVQEQWSLVGNSLK